jgi:Ni2+-binding GTPase involved in maturation of urease and hydrogenase
MCTMGSCRTGHNHAQFSDLAGVINFGADLADAHMPGTREERIIRLERDILSKNGAFARANRDRLKAAGIFMLNLVSSPGSGKTSLLVRTIADLKHRFPISVIEGEDKPLKYPDMFAEADLMLLNKIDLLPYLNFDVRTCIQFALRVNPQIQIINVSARTGEGLSAFCHWIEWRASLMRRPAHASL